MRYIHLILIGVAIPLVLTATVFAAPARGGMFGALVNDAANLQKNDQISSSTDGLIATAQASPGNNHDITLVAETLPNGLLAYKMDSHIVNLEGGGTLDLTGKYSSDATIPGPTIVLTEGDTVDLTIVNGIGSGMVGVHVHGVHYDILSDGTLEHINGVEDEGATAGSPFTVHWTAGLGTAGTWPYHDHTFGSLNGAENRGLFGTVIVNPSSGEVSAVNNKAVQTLQLDRISKEFVLYLGDDAFWGMEIDNSDGTQTPLWTNPTLGTKVGDYVRFHLIALGTDTVHTFKLKSYQWLDPGTENLIKSKDIGPLENHVFTIKAKEGNTLYTDDNTSNKLMGMEGEFKVTGKGADSIPSPVPEPF